MYRSWMDFSGAGRGSDVAQRNPSEVLARSDIAVVPCRGGEFTTYLIGSEVHRLGHTPPFGRRVRGALRAHGWVGLRRAWRAKGGIGGPGAGGPSGRPLPRHRAGASPPWPGAAPGDGGCPGAP